MLRRKGGARLLHEMFPLLSPGPALPAVADAKKPAEKRLEVLRNGTVRVCQAPPISDLRACAQRLSHAYCSGEAERCSITPYRAL